MQIVIKSSEIKQTSTGKEYKKVTIDENGAEIQASVWSDSPFYAQVNAGATIEAEVKVSADGKYKNLVGANTANRGAGLSAMKNASIEKFQNNKATQIAEAQDRSAWMWAKTNASTLLATQMIQGLSQDKIAEMVIGLATKIYNGEPTEPFNSPSKEEVDMSDIPF